MQTGRLGNEHSDAIRPDGLVPVRIATADPARSVANARRMANPVARCALLAGFAVATHGACVVLTGPQRNAQQNDQLGVTTPEPSPEPLPFEDAAACCFRCASYML